MTLVAFDFDGTLTNSEMTVLLAERLGVAEAMAEITERAMNGTIGYAESLRKRAALLAGMSESDIQAAYEQLELREGAAFVLDELSASGAQTAIVTGGFGRGVEIALQRENVSVHHIVANCLPLAGGELTGQVEGPLVDGTKDTALEEIATRQSIDMDATVAVGDGANDLSMLRIAGLAVGFEPKSAIYPHCEAIVTSMDELCETLRMRGVLG